MEAAPLFKPELIALPTTNSVVHASRWALVDGGRSRGLNGAASAAAEAAPNRVFSPAQEYDGETSPAIDAGPVAKVDCWDAARRRTLNIER